MPFNIYTVLLCCLLLVGSNCGSKSVTEQRSVASQPNASSGSLAAPQLSATTASVSSEAESAPMPNAGTSTASAKGRIAACTLITNAEIESVQGEPVKETKSNERTSGALAVSQCFYSLATFTKSVSLELTQSDPAQAAKNAPRELWMERFRRRTEKETDRDRAKDKERERDKSGAEEEEEGGKPRPVPGVGDEAYWMGNRITGALYVLKKNSIVRISIGGSDDEAVKIQKTKNLAQKALKHL